MSTTYQPICAACRSNHPSEFRKGCEGCRVRQLQSQATQHAPQLTDDQVSAMDSTMQPLEER